KQITDRRHPRCSHTSEQPNSPVGGIKAEPAEWFLSKDKSFRAFGGSVVSGLTFSGNLAAAAPVRLGRTPPTGPNQGVKVDRPRPRHCSALHWLPAFVPFRVTAATLGLTFVNKVFHQAIGGRLRDRRDQLQLTLKEVAELCGVGYQLIHKYECGLVQISAF